MRDKKFIGFFSLTGLRNMPVASLLAASFSKMAKNLQNIVTQVSQAHRKQQNRPRASPCFKADAVTFPSRFT